MTELIYLPHPKLKLHPQNIRRYYPPADVARMAESIRAAQGVLQALLIHPDPAEPGTYFVVDGNMRLAGARALGEECPLLKCEVVEADRFEQLLLMTITTEFYFPKDPISQAQHYRRLIEQEKMSVSDVAERSGVARQTIDKLLKLLELEPEIQEYMVEGKISPDLRVSRALLSLPDGEIRLKLARRFARNETSIKQIVRGCNFVLRQMARLEHDGAQAQLDAQARRQETAVRIIEIKAAHRDPKQLDSETAALIYDMAAKILCDDCRLDGLGEACLLCPGPHEFIQHLVELCGPDAGAAEEAGPAAANGKCKSPAQVRASLRGFYD